MNETFFISDFIIHTTLADGLPYRYLETSIEYHGQVRRLTVFFNNKSDRAKLELGKKFTVSGMLQDDGELYGLILNGATIEE
jgi:hypothetical protein